MSRNARSLVAAGVLALVLWLIWSRLHIVIWVPMPWWGLLLLAVLLFLAVDYLIARILTRRP
jgi:hypothetical protein